MFWRKKRQQIECKHDWHHLQDSSIPNNNGGVIDIDDACWIFCVKCEKEKLVYPHEWQRIKKKQELLKQYQS